MPIDMSIVALRYAMPRLRCGHSHFYPGYTKAFASEKPIRFGQFYRDQGFEGREIDVQIRKLRGRIWSIHVVVIARRTALTCRVEYVFVLQ